MQQKVKALEEAYYNLVKALVDVLEEGNHNGHYTEISDLYNQNEMGKDVVANNRHFSIDKALSQANIWN